MKRTLVYHEFPPFYEKDSKILILGSIPSRKSRELGFYYMHPQNKFWKVLATLTKEPFPETIEEKKEFLKKYHIALWDVLDSCEISGSSDNSIKNPVVNDIEFLLKNSQITRIFTTGKKAYQLYQKYCYPKLKKEAISLPSTSSANIANYSFEDLLLTYEIIFKETNY